MISYEDFSKLEIRIGTIKSVDVVEDADKLLKLAVDIGELDENNEPKFRQIISGIRQYFADPQELIGKQCPFLVNLEPRVIRGFESQGMILAASTEETFALLHLSTELPSGSKVK